MRPIADSKSNETALAVVRNLLANTDGVSEQHPSGTRFIPVLIDEDNHIIQVAVEEPASDKQPVLEPVSAFA